jgi:SAM-dependent methyltransferase
LSRVGIAPTARCLDLGCGGGDVTRALAGITSDGFAVGADLDETKLELARAEAATAGVENIEFRLEDVMRPVRDERFDPGGVEPRSPARQPSPMATTTLPFALRSASSLIASAARSSGYVDDTCGRSFPSRHQPTSSSTFWR